MLGSNRWELFTCLVLLFTLLPFKALSQSPTAEIKVGFGRAEVRLNADVSVSSSDLEKSLILYEDLAPFVMSEKFRTAQVNDIEEQDLQNQEVFQKKVFESFQNKFPEVAKVSREAPVKQSSSKDSRRWVVGEEFQLPTDQSLRELYVVGGDVDIAGKVDRLVVLSGRVHLRSTAVVRHLQVQWGEVNQEPGARVFKWESESGWVQNQWSHSSQFVVDDWDEFLWVVYLFGFVIFMGISLLGMVSDVLFPDFQRVSRQLLLNEFGTSLLYGGLHLLLAPVVLFLLLASLVGWVLVPFYFTVLFVLMGLGGLHGVYWLYKKVKLPSLVEGVTGKRQLVSGLTLFLLMILPVIGPFLVFFLVISGFGSMTLAMVRRLQKRRGHA